MYRSTAPDGVYAPIGGDIAGNYYTDNDVLPGETYYYRIAPALKGCRQSETAAASLYPLKPFCYEERAITGISAVGGIVVKDNVCYVSGGYGGRSGIHCFSLQNPAAPGYFYTIPLAAADKLAIVGDYLAVTAAETIESIVIDNGKLYYLAYSDDMGMIIHSVLEIYNIITQVTESYGIRFLLSLITRQIYRRFTVFPFTLWIMPTIRWYVLLLSTAR